MMSLMGGKCCVFQPAFGCCAHPKVGQSNFLAIFVYMASSGREGTYNCECDPRRKLSNKSQKRLKKVVRQAFGGAQHPKAGQNTQQVSTFVTLGIRV